MAITKAVIPAAGWGTRMLPAAKAVPKELLPILDRPTIQYVVEEAAAAGITDALLITSRDKRAIEDHFDRHAEMEARLEKTGKEKLLASINDVMKKIRVHATRQREQLGLGHAVLQAESYCGNDSFLCLLGDTIFSGDPTPAQQLIDAHDRLGGCVIGLEEVPLEKVSRYGIASGKEVAPGVLKLDQLVEKPAPDKAPSRLAIAARYVLTHDVFDALHQLKPGALGELQLTDALHTLIDHGDVHGVVLHSHRHDVGNVSDWLKTNLIYASRDPQLWSMITDTVRALDTK